MIRAGRVFLLLMSAGSTACISDLMPGSCKAEMPDPKAPSPDSFLVTFETSRGSVDVMARKSWAPLGSDRFYKLVKDGHFDDARFFRVIKGFVAQFGLSGDPKVNRAWESRCIADEPVKHTNSRGTVTFANAGAQTRSTQMFFNLGDNPTLDTYEAGFPPIGEVVTGMSVVDSLYSGYGDSAPKSGSRYGREGPNQDSLAKLGNAYLAAWPKLDYIKTARVVREWPTR